MAVTLWIYGVPLAMLLVAIVETLGKSWKITSRTSFVLSAVACGWAAFAFGRLEGFDGSYWPELRWRWQPTHEELLTEREPMRPYDGTAASIELSATDWPGFRGANRNSRVAALRVQADWDSATPGERWRIPVGPAWSSFACVGGRLFTQEQRGDREAIICCDAETGQEIWRHEDETRFTEVVSGAGPRATPTFADGRLYAMGAKATLSCLDAATGEPIWCRDLVTELGAEVPMWGFSGSPLVTHDLVLVYVDGRDDYGLVAFDSGTGDPAWHVAGNGMNYSSAQPAELAGVELVLFGNETGLLGIEPATGEVLWQFTPSGWKGVSMVQPQPISDRSVIVPLGDGVGVARIEIQRDADAWRVTERWTSRHLKPSFNDFVYHEGHLYGFDQNIFTCVDAETGRRKWKQGRYGFGQVLLAAASSSLIVTCESGDIVLLAADPANHQELGRIQALNGKTWNHLIAVGDRLFVRNGTEAACFQLPIATDS
jgi:outer membrane protein assembly factor BamB